MIRELENKLVSKNNSYTQHNKIKFKAFSNYVITIMRIKRIEKYTSFQNNVKIYQITNLEKLVTHCIKAKFTNKITEMLVSDAEINLK